jgi:hypothetical protein
MSPAHRHHSRLQAPDKHGLDVKSKKTKSGYNLKINRDHCHGPEILSLQRFPSRGEEKKDTDNMPSSFESEKILNF